MVFVCEDYLAKQNVYHECINVSSILKLYLPQFLFFLQ